jgi:hypothetical protein
MNSLQNITLPNSFAVKRLTGDDFALDTRDKICLYSDACTLVLFYTESKESKYILSAFKIAAESTSNMSFGACHMVLEKSVADAFVMLKGRPDHPLSWCSERPFPFILVYRNGFPVNFYDGPADAQILISFCLNVACKTEFHSRNFRLIDKVREEMWNTYKAKKQVADPGDFIIPVASYKKKF